MILEVMFLRRVEQRNRRKQILVQNRIYNNKPKPKEENRTKRKQSNKTHTKKKTNK